MHDFEIQLDESNGPHKFVIVDGSGKRVAQFSTLGAATGFFGLAPEVRERIMREFEQNGEAQEEGHGVPPGAPCEVNGVAADQSMSRSQSG